MADTSPNPASVQKCLASKSGHFVPVCEPGPQGPHSEGRDRDHVYGMVVTLTTLITIIRVAVCGHMTTMCHQWRLSYNGFEYMVLYTLQ